MIEPFLQQTFDLSIKNNRTFDNFICSANLEQKNMLLFFLNHPTEKTILLSGETGTGKSHLLHAACHHFQSQGGKASFVSLKHPTTISALLSAKLTNTLVCIDDVHLAENHIDLENLLFKLYNHAELENCLLIWSTQKSTPFSRKDLQSRLQSMLSIQLKPYPPNDVLAITLQYLALTQSSIPSTVCEFLIKNYSRNIPKLISKLKEIEEHACSIQKKITLKMAKELIYKDLHQLD